MAASKNYGPKRLVVGAHYGVMDFLAQRLTAIIMAVYTLVLFIGVLVMPGFTYESWKALFTFHVYALPLGQLLVTLAFLSLAYHAWIGVRDIWMDYVRAVGVRLLLQVLTILWLVGSVVYFAQIIWRL
ncbi:MULTISPECIES: succinate dehydrogenase, hydrophobic membrane anchor protein [unclassified Achromobacter]|jgi:succinate dehydrogenase / fumarate reductase, membrane anchor subunit|uniref:succinate dehydrogenase, hydrophobic membrane anchor protein n=1 Tax=unclassified Achromobacter TaxID=2626865 RepID=UPI000B51DB44|nr:MULTISPECIES: succinate dehydrogenase, hydrophobic membrane anchor protein [unclassified Achromobacter]OWT70360.1 succinate dehydrogenase, hydrophobic membrane anchor protein [Achromobacter sp. HZ34]OWT71900.1 succinate dehydrogenase, hydrophobic membrane anchor protein [Achromobacter sp. HZ28]